MSKPGLLFLFLPVTAFFLFLPSCKTGVSKTFNETSYLVELRQGLDGSYLMEQNGQWEGMQLKVNERPVNRTRNQWICTIYYKKPTNLNSMVEQLKRDSNILHIIPASNNPDPPVNDTIKAPKKITPKF